MNDYAMSSLLKINGPPGLLLLGIVVIIILYMIIRRVRKNSSEAKRAVYLNMRSDKIRNGLNISIHKKKSRYEPPAQVNTSRPKINIRKRHIPESLKGVSNDFFDQLISTNSFLNFSMSELWQDSVLSDVYMNIECCKHLDEYLKKENLEQIQFESNMIPEIGGILLGRFNEVKPSDFRITLEEFIAIESVNPNLYTLEFCTDSLVKELGDLADTYPALSVVGWFHTHPGHGLFLSIPDLTIQMGFFKESYQIAMEIDSLSKELDTGFFTQKTNGVMNNSIEKMPSWYSWKSIINVIN